MDEFRYILGLILVLIMPVVITFWLVIHSGADFWRKQNAMLAYWVAGICIVAVLTTVIFNRNFFIGIDLGRNYVLFTLGLIIYAASWVLWRPVKRHLDFKTFAGLPEVKNEPIPLITDGPFSIIRHPRYFMVLIGVAGWCLMANYAGVYWMGLASLVGLLVIIKLEERDLVQRFGKEYRAYQKSVPALFPSWSGIKRFKNQTEENGSYKS